MLNAIRDWFRRQDLKASIAYAEAELSLAIASNDTPRANRLRQIRDNLREEADSSWGKSYG